MIAPECPWDGMTPGTIRFCEARLCSWISEPANAWSNMAFLAVGVALLVRAHRQGRAPLYFVGVTSILLGLASFSFHMSGVFFAEFLDVSAMYLVGSLMLTLEARRFVPMSGPKMALLFVAVGVVPMTLLFFFRTLGIALFGCQVALVYLSNIVWKCRRTTVDHRFAFLLGSTFAVALGLWTLDLTGVMCRPDNHVFTGHSAWHVLTAVCLYFFYRHQEQFFPASETAGLGPIGGAGLGVGADGASF